MGFLVKLIYIGWNRHKSRSWLFASFQFREKKSLSDFLRSRIKNSKDLIITTLVLSIVPNNRLNRFLHVARVTRTCPNQNRLDSIYLLASSYASIRSRDFLFFVAGHFERVLVNKNFAFKAAVFIHHYTSNSLGL